MKEVKLVIQISWNLKLLSQKNYLTFQILLEEQVYFCDRLPVLPNGSLLCDLGLIKTFSSKKSSFSHFFSLKVVFLC